MSAAAEWMDRELPKLSPDDVMEFVGSLDEDQQRWILGPLFDFEGTFAREDQREPLGTWRVWLLLAGRGAGKTRAGGEWVIKQVASGMAKRIALVARTSADVRDVMVEGESGIMECSPPWFRPKFEPSKRRLTWYNEDGTVRALATVYSAEEPNLLRGPQHDAAWCDELASWKTKEAWDNLIFGLRIGINPRAVVTTTPKPTILLRDLINRSSTVVSKASTFENLRNLAPAFIEDVLDRYEGTSLGQQELYAEMLEEAEGALWRRKWIDDHRWDVGQMGAHPDLDALWVAVDPAASSKKTSSETGIVVVGRGQVTEAKGAAKGQTRAHYFVLEDKSGRYTPNGWGQLAVEGFYSFEADGIVGERNNGGDMVEATVTNIDDSVPFESVWASRGKAPRASPVAALYEQGRVHHVGLFRELEDQLCQWEPETGAESPDRLDALVWGVFSMMPTAREPKLTTGLDLSGGGLGRSSPWRGE